MIDTLYNQFQRWSEKGSIYLISDLHFEDEDCKLIDENWISPEEQVNIINKYAHKNDTLIVLGDVGKIEWISKLKAGHKVLILGNHDSGENNYRRKFTMISKWMIESYDENGNELGYYVQIPIDNRLFDEVYSGPLMIAEKIILSHVPIPNINWALNIHGHDHNPYSKNDKFHCNVAANKTGYVPISLKELINSGKLNKIESLNRQATNEATVKVKKRGHK